ncbi:MAG: nitrogen fixation protein [Rhodospirillales bacterium]|nr:nitrogen fixation protein [Rhodospirillales bacterium]
MKIAVTSQNFRTVTGHAGRARRFLVYEAGAGGEPVEVERLDLPKELALHDFHGSGPHPVDAVDVIVSGGFCDGFAQRLAARGVAVALTRETDPLAAAKALLSDPAATAGAASCGGDQHRHRHAHEHAPGHRRHDPPGDLAAEAGDG